VFTGSVGSSPIAAAGTYSATYKTQYYQTVTSSPATGAGYISVDSVAQVTPYQAWWDSGSSHTIAAISLLPSFQVKASMSIQVGVILGSVSLGIACSSYDLYGQLQLQYYLVFHLLGILQLGRDGTMLGLVFHRPSQDCFWWGGIQYETTAGQVRKSELRRKCRF